MAPTRLLSTKFFPPPQRPNWVSRPRLLERLEAGLSPGCRLILVSAPPGYGKTTLVSAWTALGHSSAWLTLDPQDNHPARFFTYLIAALQTLDPSIGSGLQGALDLPQFLAPEAAAAELINDITALARPVLLVLDDYQAITHPEIHDSLEYLIEHQPANLHLVLTTREDPPFALSRLRARGQLVEIRARDLSFGAPEAESFLNRSLGLGLSPQSVEHLTRMTEGWIAGLQLAGLAIHQQEDADELVAAFGGSQRYIIDYLLEEVLKRQPPEIRAFLKQTSILERFNAGLCEAVVEGETGAAAILEQLERSNLFLIPLDQARHWYRYHRLFADVLRLGLSPEEEPTLHRRAAAWYEAQGFPAEAIDHYLNAGLAAEATRLIRQAAQDLLKSGQAFTLLGWLEALPLEQVVSDPDLATEKAIALLLAGDARRAAAWVRQMETQVRPGASPGYEGRRLALQAWLQFTSGSSRGLVELAQRALEALGRADNHFQYLALIALGTGAQWNGNLALSCQAYERAYQLSQENGDLFVAASALANLAINLYELGDLQRAEVLCHHALEQYVDGHGRPLPVLGIVIVALALVCYHQYRLDEARQLAEQGLELSRRLYSSRITGGHAEYILADLAFIQGDLSQALELIAETRRLAQEHQIAFTAYKMDLLEANIHLRRGDAPAARRILDGLDARIGDDFPTAREAAQREQAFLLISEGHLEEAKALLAEVETVTRAKGCTGWLIPIRVLQALAGQAQDDQAAAVEALADTVRLAAPQGYRMAILRHGEAVAPLLSRVRSEDPAFVDGLLAILKGGEAVLAPASPLPGPVPPPEPLSEQELKVLRLVVAGCSNQEIASQLVISPGTAKWHVHNILSKLGAASRAQAIARAHQLGIE